MHRSRELKLSLDVFWDTLCSKLAKTSATTRKNSNNSKAELSKVLIDASSFIFWFAKSFKKNVSGTAFLTKIIARSMKNWSTINSGFYIWNFKAVKCQIERANSVWFFMMDFWGSTKKCKFRCGDYFFCMGFRMEKKL